MGESICLKCGNADGTNCIAGRADTLKGMIIIGCPDFTMEKKTKAIVIDETAIREILTEHFKDDKPTDEQIKEFIDFMSRDVIDFVIENWNCFLDQQASEGVKQLMDSVTEE